MSLVPRWMHEMFAARFNKMLEAEGQGDLQYVIRDEGPDIIVDFGQGVPQTIISKSSLEIVAIEHVEKLTRVATAARMYLKAERIEHKSAFLHHWFVVSHASDGRAIKALECWRKELDEAVKAMEVLSV